MAILLGIHSLVRWVILLIGFTALVKFGLGMARGSSPDKMDRGLISGFSGLIDLQALLGVLLIISLALTAGDLIRAIPHVVFMVAAVGVAHLPMRWRSRQDAGVLRNNVLVIVGVLALVLIGVTVVPQGWFG